MPGESEAQRARIADAILGAGRAWGMYNVGSSHDRNILAGVLLTVYAAECERHRAATEALERVRNLAGQRTLADHVTVRQVLDAIHGKRT